MGITEDRNDPALTHGVDEEPVPMAEKYLVLDESSRLQNHVPGFEQPFRWKYRHIGPNGCGEVTIIGRPIAETYQKDPSFYGATYCVHCSKHRPVGDNGEFIWVDPVTEWDTNVKVGTIG